MNKSSGDMLLCSKCITAPRFTKWIRQNGKRDQCDFDVEHGRRRNVVTVEAFAGYVDDFFREHYQIGRNKPVFSDDSGKVYYKQVGSSLSEILSSELLNEDDAIVNAIIENLPDVSVREITQGAEAFYDDTVSYESIHDVEKDEQADEQAYWFANRFIYQWQDFCEIVQYEKRFFKTKQLLDKLFGKPLEYEGGEVNPVYTLNADEKIFRARVFDGSFNREVLELNPIRELSSPPRERAKAGRMNVEYIPAFYGAFSEQTAVAELRPGIGEEIAVGTFTLNRKVKVFDFTVFSRAASEKWLTNHRHTRYDFITQMEEEMSKRVLPYEKQRQYIATQIVAEYLKEYFNCEAIIYRSSVATGRSAESRNIVFLPKKNGFTGGDTAILQYQRFDIREVKEVSYTLSRQPQF